MTCNDIQKDLLLWAQSGSSEIVVPNYYLGRYECDVLKITKADMFVEYEIKVSRADFKKDAEKRHENWLTSEVTTKHDHIRAGKRCHRFYFVVPEGMVTPDEVPDGFGLIYAKPVKYTRCNVEYTQIVFSIKKVSKLFKAKKCEQWMIRHIATNLVFKLQKAKSRAKGAEQAYRQLLKSNPTTKTGPDGR